MKPILYNFLMKLFVTFALFFSLWGLNLVVFELLPTPISAIVFLVTIFGFAFGMGETFKKINEATERMRDIKN